ncbi:MAG: T9SS type A sorting domain-containing protein, partial [Candidatus Cloacimonetes bacterium]|nr:T9SS type A sorting domain-containing protein [Candidatus Cloacimonadota bacterium]
VNWSWDFDNDGIIDSNEQNPDWIYGEPGTYSVRLEVSDGTNTNSVLEVDIIQVFNGHTALEFTDSESCINCPAENSMNLIDAFTIEAWIYLYSYGPDASWGSGRIFDKSAVSIFLNNQFPLYPDQSLIVKMHHSDGTLSTSTTPATSLQLNQWQHVAVSYDGIDQVRIFVDGLQMMFNQPTAPSGNLEDNSQENIFIGNLAAMNKAFDGIIDEVRIWNFFMDQTQIQQNMNSYLHGWESGLMHYWQVNEGNGDTIFDLAGSNNAEIHDLNWCAGIELDPVEISTCEIPAFNFILKNYPNPFNPTTTISFNLATETNVSVDIYNVKGQKVKTLVNERMPEGQHEVIWDGLNQDNNSVSSGVYLYEVKIENQKFLNRMILIK